MSHIAYSVFCYETFYWKSLRNFDDFVKVGSSHWQYMASAYGAFLLSRNVSHISGVARREGSFLFIMALIRGFRVSTVGVSATGAAVREGGVWRVLLTRKRWRVVNQHSRSWPLWRRAILVRQGRSSAVLSGHNVALITESVWPLVASFNNVRLLAIFFCSRSLLPGLYVE